jgi:hypothetical protein
MVFSPMTPEEVKARKEKAAQALKTCLPGIAAHTDRLRLEYERFGYADLVDPFDDISMIVYCVKGSNEVGYAILDLKGGSETSLMPEIVVDLVVPDGTTDIEVLARAFHELDQMVERAEFFARA